MSPEEIVYDLRTLLRQLHDDASVSDAHLLNKVNMYRAMSFISEYNTFKRIEDSWFQRLKLKKVTSVFSSDDPEIEFTTVKFGKFTLPQVIELENNASIRLTTASGMKQIYYHSFPFLKAMIEAKDYRLEIYNFYSRIGNQYYVYPYLDNVSPVVIAENPMEGFLFETEQPKLTDLVHGKSYTVISGSILPTSNAGDLALIKKDETFIVDNNYTYTGNGKVILTDQITEIQKTSEYPISSDLLQRIVIEILTKDFQIEKSQVVDIINDSMDQLKIAFSEIGQRR